MGTYQPNSHRFREEQKETKKERKIEKVVSGTAKVKKKSELGKVAKVFISDDAKNVGDYVLLDVVIPMLKKGLMGALDMILNGNTGGSYRDRSTASKVSYRKFYDDRRDDRHGYESRARNRARFDYDDILYESRAEAEAVLDRMWEAIEEYDYVSVADMYDMADLTAPFTSNKYGWTSLRSAYVSHVRDGYIIKLPRVEPLD